MTRALISVAGFLLALQGDPSSVVRIDSREQGRTFYVDTDRPSIRKALRDASAPSPAGEMPQWTGVYPGATRWGKPSPNEPVDFGVATLNTGDAPDVVFAYHESRMRASRGVTINDRERDRVPRIGATRSRLVRPTGCTRSTSTCFVARETHT